jgi:hypothetical protein
MDQLFHRAIELRDKVILKFYGYIMIKLYKLEHQIFFLY